MSKNNVCITANLDEVTDEYKKAVNFFLKQKLKFVEVRTINKKNIVHLTHEEIKDISRNFAKNNLKVAAIASPLFKWNIKGHKSNLKIDNFYFNPDLTERDKKKYIVKALEAANTLNTKIVRIFSNLQARGLTYRDFLNDENVDFALNEASKRGITLALENEPVCLVKTLSELTKVTEKYKDLKIWFDIANFYDIGERVEKNAIEQFKRNIVYFHLKDFIQDQTAKRVYVPFGEGGLNYKRIISDILNTFENNTTPLFLSLETHVKTQKQEAVEKSIKNISKMIKTKRIGYGIVGAGRISKTHAEAIRNNENSELRGVFDTETTAKNEYARIHDATAYDSLTELLNDKTIKVVNICTPHDTHLEICEKALSKNKKVLSEKPFAIDSKSLKRALTFKKINTDVFVALQNNFNPAVEFLFDLVENKELGKINYFSINLRWFRNSAYFSDWHGSKKRSGGSLFNQGMHALGIMARIIDLTPKSAKVMIKQVKNTPDSIENIHMSLVTLKNGETGSIEVFLDSTDKNIEAGIFISGDKGSVKLGGLAFDEITYLSLKNKTVPQFVKNCTIYGKGHSRLIRILSDKLLGKDTKDNLLVRPKEIQKITGLIEYIYKQI